MPVAFVTGGTGFLGLNLIEQLLAERWEVVALHRPTANLKPFREKDIQLKEPDITPEKAIMVTSQSLCNSQKAENHLDYHSVPLRSMIEDCFSGCSAKD